MEREHWSVGVREDLDREPLRQWMRGVLQSTGWSAAQWARRARTSGSNITRFIRDQRASLPTVRTITKLAAVAPMPPPPLAMLRRPSDQASEELAEIYQGIPAPKRAEFLEVVRGIGRLMGEDAPEPARAKGGLR